MQEFDLDEILAQVPKWEGPINKIQTMRKLTPSEKLVLSYIREAKETTLREIVKNTGIPLSTVTRIVERLSMMWDLLDRTLTKTGGRAWLYRLKSNKAAKNLN